MQAWINACAACATAQGPHLPGGRQKKCQKIFRDLQIWEEILNKKLITTFNNLIKFIALQRELNLILIM